MEYVYTIHYFLEENKDAIYSCYLYESGSNNAHIIDIYDQFLFQEITGESMVPVLHRPKKPALIIYYPNGNIGILEWYLYNKKHRTHNMSFYIFNNKSEIISSLLYYFDNLAGNRSLHEFLFTHKDTYAEEYQKLIKQEAIHLFD